MELQVQLSYSRELANRLYQKPGESNYTLMPYFFKIHFSINPS